MKKILLLAILLIGFNSFSQYEDEIKLLNEACVTSELSIDSVFNQYTDLSDDEMYVYHDELHDSYYLIEYSEYGTIASYVEHYDKKRLNMMKKSVKNATNDYRYIVSAFKDDNTIIITTTKK